MRKILIVDDDEFFCRIHKFHLESAGFTVWVAYDGTEAIEVTKKKIPDLILLDIVMPNKNGFEALQELKNSTKHKKVPVIIVSNLSQKSDIEEGLRLGAEEYLVKSSYKVNQLIARIRHYLGKNK